jgi:hypothetical protein
MGMKLQPVDAGHRSTGEPEQPRFVLRETKQPRNHASRQETDGSRESRAKRREAAIRERQFSGLLPSVFHGSFFRGLSKMIWSGAGAPMRFTKSEEREIERLFGGG